MPLAMTRPTPHPKSHVYRVRVAIPASLRETAQRLYGRRSEFIESLGTKDPKEAKRMAPAAIARLQAKLEVAKRAAAGAAPLHLTERDIQALAGERYLAILAEHDDDPGNPESLDLAIGGQADQLEQVNEDHDVERVLRLTAAQLSAARTALLAAGLPASAESVTRLAEARWWAEMKALAALSACTGISAQRWGGLSGRARCDSGQVFEASPETSCGPRPPGRSICAPGYAMEAT